MDKDSIAFDGHFHDADHVLQYSDFALATKIRVKSGVFMGSTGFIIGEASFGLLKVALFEKGVRLVLKADLEPVV